MKSNAELLFTDFEKATANLKEGLEHASDNLAIDGTIKRFELCYEIAWKLIKEHLETTGIICKNPKECFKSAKENLLITNEMNWILMIEDRDFLVHCYTFEQSRSIFDNIKKMHYSSLQELYTNIKSHYKSK